MRGIERSGSGKSVVFTTLQSGKAEGYGLAKLASDSRHFADQRSTPPLYVSEAHFVHFLQRENFCTPLALDDMSLVWDRQQLSYEGRS